MDIYQLDYILHEPEESEGWMYLAEVPTLQGCMAWGETLEEPFGSRPGHHPAPEGKRGTAAPGDTLPAQPRRQPDRNRMTYRELRRKLEVPGCRFQRQADGSHEMWVNPANGRGPPFPGTGTVICPPAPSTEFAETRESPGQTSTRHRPKPPRSSSHRPPGSRSRA